MLLVGDVKCYYCGFVSGELVSSPEQSLRNGKFRPAPGVQLDQMAGGRLRCARCVGPVYIDDIRYEKPRQPIGTFERERPGRPRRSRTRSADEVETVTT